jgi:hypothetical protein
MYLSVMPETRGLSLLEIRQLFSQTQQSNEKKPSLFRTWLRKLTPDDEKPVKN